MSSCIVYCVCPLPPGLSTIANNTHKLNGQGGRGGVLYYYSCVRSLSAHSESSGEFIQLFVKTICKMYSYLFGGRGGVETVASKRDGVVPVKAM